MRAIVITCLVLSFSSSLAAVPVPADPESVAPTAEQLAAAQKAYLELGGTYELVTDSQNNGAIHTFQMRSATGDADLRGLPNLPFRFSLKLVCTKVTDAGLTELTNLKHLIALGYLFPQTHSV